MQGKDPTGRITLHPHSARVRVYAGDSVIADSQRSLELRETDHPPVQYLPPEDVQMELLQPSDKTTHCPYKGDTVYYSVELERLAVENAAWCYEHPFEPLQAIAGRLAFERRLVEVEIGEEDP